MLANRDIQMRDPFVVPVAEERLYYLFGTTDKDIWQGPGTGFNCYRGSDLENWEGPFPAFRPPEGFWGTTNFWAPEVHRCRGRWYMLATFYGSGVRRGTAILAADRLPGPFVPHSDGAVTPRDWECLDGTLFVDDSGSPWMVFCHEWLQVIDGETCAIRLAGDFKHSLGDPVVLFHASDALWSKAMNEEGARVTDGPFLYRASDGGLLMLWASHGEKGYVQGLARSTSGLVTGPWVQDSQPVFEADGGHGMLFRRFDGQLMLTLHSPNDSPNERPVFLPVEEKNRRIFCR